MNRLIAFVFVIAGLCSSSSFASGLYVCNYTGEALSVSWVSYEGGVWVSRAGSFVAASGCNQLTTSFTNTRYYLYAVSESGKEWGANYGFCLPFGNGVIYNADNTSSCHAKNYFSVWVPDLLTGQFPDHYVHAFGNNLYGPNNLGLNHPRA